jgi:sortase A
MGPLRRATRETGLALITAGVVILLFVAYQLWGTTFTEEHHQKALATQFHAALRRAPAATSARPTEVLPSAPQGDAIDHLVIPAIHVDKYVVEGTDENDLREGPGHYIGTAYPGQLGNVGIAGHRTTYGAPFFDLNELKVGDKILITDLDDRTWLYLVDQAPLVVSPGDVAVLDPTPFAQLTLTTCNPRYSATSRLIVFARLEGRATLPPPARPVSAPISLQGPDNLGRGESGAAAPALAYGLVAVALWVATRLAINRTRRWWRLAAYVVGIGLCLVPLWFCFENVILLLPQSI